MCRKFALNILGHTSHLLFLCVWICALFVLFGLMTTIAKICIMHGIWHDLFVGNYTVDKLKIGYNIQIVLCIEQSVSADFPLLLILIDLFFVYFWANRRWVFWTVVQCQDQNQNREHKQTNRHYHLYHHISHYASRLLTAAIGHNKSMILFQLQKKKLIAKQQLFDDAPLRCGYKFIQPWFVDI